MDKPPPFLFIVEENDLVFDLDGVAHPAVALGQGILPAHQVLLIAKMGVEGFSEDLSDEDAVKVVDLEASRAFSRDYIVPKLVQNTMDAALLNTQMNALSPYPASGYDPIPEQGEQFNEMARVAFDRMNADGYDPQKDAPQLHRQLSEMAMQAVGAITAEDIEASYFQIGERAYEIASLDSGGLSGSGLLVGIEDALQSLARIQGLNAPGDGKFIEESFRAMPEWAQLLAEQEGVIVSTAASHKRHGEASGTSMNHWTEVAPLNIFINVHNLSLSSVEQVHHTMREEITHALHSRAEQKASNSLLTADYSDPQPETNEKSVYNRYIRLGEAKDALAERIKSTPNHPAELLIKMTERNGGSFFVRGTDSTISTHEILTDVCDAERYLRRNLGKSAAHTSTLLNDAFAEDTVGVVREYQQDWMQEAAGIAAKKFGAEKAASLLEKWQQNPMAHRIEIADTSQMSQGQAMPGRAKSQKSKF